MNDSLQELLAGIPTGDVQKDDREGDHYDATLKMVEVAHQSNGFVIVLTLTNLRDIQGRLFDYPVRVSLPTTDSEAWQHRQFLDAAHAAELIELTDRRQRFFETPASREAIAAAFSAVAGVNMPIRIAFDKHGELRSRWLRRKD